MGLMRVEVKKFLKDCPTCGGSGYGIISYDDYYHPVEGECRCFTSEWEEVPFFNWLLSGLISVVGFAGIFFIAFLVVALLVVAPFIALVLLALEYTVLAIVIGVVWLIIFCIVFAG